MIFENGKLIEKNIIPIADYKIGDKLSLLTNLNNGNEYIHIQGIIKENNGKMVRLEIFPLVIGETTIEIQKEILDNFWINPRYCRRAE